MGQRRQHFLNFLPEPHGLGSLRPTGLAGASKARRARWSPSRYYRISLGAMMIRVSSISVNVETREGAMVLRPSSIDPVPEETARVALAAFRKVPC